jgi:hypothetical protein
MITGLGAPTLEEAMRSVQEPEPDVQHKPVRATVNVEPWQAANPNNYDLPAFLRQRNR